MAARFTPRPAEDRIAICFTVGSARRAYNAALNGYHLCGLYLATLPPGAEQGIGEETRAELLRLSRWFGRLLEDEG